MFQFSAVLLIQNMLYLFFIGVNFNPLIYTYLYDARSSKDRSNLISVSVEMVVFSPLCTLAQNRASEDLTLSNFNNKKHASESIKLYVLFSCYWVRMI